jgi:hypothetical protein
MWFLLVVLVIAVCAVVYRVNVYPVVRYGRVPVRLLGPYRPRHARSIADAVAELHARDGSTVYVRLP